MEFNATFIVAIVSFAVFILIMNTIYYKPVLKIINERKALIDGNYEYARKTGEQAVFLLEEKEQRLLKTSKKAGSIVSDKVNETNAQAASRMLEAQKLSQKEIQGVKEKLFQQEQQIASELSVNELAKSISAKLMGGVA